MAETQKTKVVYRRSNPVYRRSTLRKMSPVTRNLARLIGEATSVTRRLKAILPLVQELEQKELANREKAAEVLNRLTG